MGPQLSIVVIVDSPAVVVAKTLDGCIYLIDNNGPAGSTGEGTPHLTTVVDAPPPGSFGRAPVLNWICFGLGGIPPFLDGRGIGGALWAGASIPVPSITNIRGEAVAERVILPAQYGSPDLYGRGLYWSAVVDASRAGTFTYVMDITVKAFSRDGMRPGVTLSHEARLVIPERAAPRNGFEQPWLPMQA